MRPNRQRNPLGELERLAIAFALVLTGCWGMLRLTDLAGDDPAADAFATDDFVQESNVGSDADVIDAADLAAPPVVAASELATLPDEQIDQAVIELIFWEIGDDWSRADEVLRDMAPGYRPFYAMSLVEFDIGAAGMYEAATWGEAVLVDAIAGYRLIGAVEHAAILEVALALLRAEEYDWSQCPVTLDPDAACEPPVDSLDYAQLDARWFETTENPIALRAAYVRAHPEQFAATS